MNAPADRLIDIFNEAKAIPAGVSRDQFLESACGDDAHLRAKLARLLAADESAGAFLTPTPLARHSAMVTEEVGDFIDRYKLLEKIGEGGYGVVYLAEQEQPVRRRVALKVIKAGMDTRQVIARFEGERQALALMNHPNIARVLDAGATEAGRPFFVMELVAGTRITDYCDANRLRTEERLELFVQVCDAVQHAHQKGIIHRDLKPSNILVTAAEGAAVPKVIDFGIAKATEGRLSDLTGLTEALQFIGTPAYMSPEQAEMSTADIDTRTDVYSLGVLLYELLTGRTPFDARHLMTLGMNEVRRVIQETQPAKPSTRLSTLDRQDLTTTAAHRQTDGQKLLHTVRGDLDWIVIKCLEKDRARRYQTCSALADDVRRHLKYEPVEARPPSRVYQFRKMVRRNKLAFAAGIAVAASLVIGFTTATSMYFRESEARERAAAAEKLGRLRLTEVSAERDAKEMALQEAEAISTFMSEVFQSPDPARDGRAITVAETIDKAAKKLETDLSDQPARRAKLRAVLANTYEALGLTRQALPLKEKVLEYYRTISGSEHPGLPWAMHNLAISYARAGRWDEALKLRENVLQLRRKALRTDHPDTLLAMGNLADSYASVGRHDEALTLREEVLALRRKALGPDHITTLWATQNLALSYAAVGRRDEGRALCEELLARCRRILGSEHPTTLTAMFHLADAEWDGGNREQALKLREEVLTLRRRVVGAEHPETIWTMNNLALSYFAAGRRDEALNLREEVLTTRRKVLGAKHPATLWAMKNLAVSYQAADRSEEALRMREDLLALCRNVFGPGHPDTLSAMQHTADSYRDAGRQDEARKLREELAQVLALRRKESASERAEPSQR